MAECLFQTSETALGHEGSGRIQMKYSQINYQSVPKAFSVLLDTLLNA